MLLLLLLLHNVLARDLPKEPLIIKITSCPNEGYFFRREPLNVINTQCYLCFCQKNRTAICWERKNNRCDVEGYHFHRVGRGIRERRSPKIIDNNNEGHAVKFIKHLNTCKRYESSYSKGCPPVDWCEGCTLCECNEGGSWDCRQLKFCPNGKPKTQSKRNSDTYLNTKSTRSKQTTSIPPYYDLTRKPIQRKPMRNFSLDADLLKEQQNNKKKRSHIKTIIKNKYLNQAAKVYKGKNRKRDVIQNSTVHLPRAAVKKVVSFLQKVYVKRHTEENNKSIVTKIKRNKRAITSSFVMEDLPSTTEISTATNAIKSNDVSSTNVPAFRGKSDASRYVNISVADFPNLSNTSTSTDESRSTDVNISSTNLPSLTNMSTPSDDVSRFIYVDVSFTDLPTNISTPADASRFTNVDLPILINNYTPTKESASAGVNISSTDLFSSTNMYTPNDSSKFTFIDVLFTDLSTFTYMPSEESENVSTTDFPTSTYTSTPTDATTFTYEDLTFTDLPTETSSQTDVPRYTYIPVPTDETIQTDELFSSTPDFTFPTFQYDDSTTVLYDTTIVTKPIPVKQQIKLKCNMLNDETPCHIIKKSKSNVQTETNQSNITFDSSDINDNNAITEIYQKNGPRYEANKSNETFISTVIDSNNSPTENYEKSIHENKIEILTHLPDLHEVSQLKFQDYLQNITGEIAADNASRDQRKFEGQSKNVTQETGVINSTFFRLKSSKQYCKYGKKMLDYDENNKTNKYTKNDNKSIEMPEKSHFSTKVNNSHNDLKNILQLLRFNTTKKFNRNIINVMKYMKRVMNKPFSSAKKKHSKNTIFLKRYMIDYLCETFGPCYVEPRNFLILQFKLDDLNNQTVKILKTISEIKGLLRRFDESRANKTSSNNKSSLVMDIKKLNAILHDTYINENNIGSLTNEQIYNMNQIKQKAKQFIKSAVKFSTVLDEVITLLTSGQKLRIAMRPAAPEKNQQLEKLKHQILEYNLLQNTFMRKMLDSITKLNKLQSKQTPLSKIGSIDNKTIELGTAVLFENLRSLKKFAETLQPNRRQKRNISDKDSMSYLLSLMELFVEQTLRRSTRQPDGIDILLEAIKNTPNVSPFNKQTQETRIDFSNDNENNIKIKRKSGITPKKSKQSKIEPYTNKHSGEVQSTICDDSKDSCSGSDSQAISYDKIDAENEKFLYDMENPVKQTLNESSKYRNKTASDKENIRRYSIIDKSRNIYRYVNNVKGNVNHTFSSKPPKNTLAGVTSINSNANKDLLIRLTSEVRDKLKKYNFKGDKKVQSSKKSVEINELLNRIEKNRRAGKKRNSIFYSGSLENKDISEDIMETNDLVDKDENSGREDTNKDSMNYSVYSESKDTTSKERIEIDRKNRGANKKGGPLLYSNFPGKKHLSKEAKKNKSAKDRYKRLMAKKKKNNDSASVKSIKDNSLLDGMNEET